MTPRPDEETGAPRRREPDGGFGAWFRSKECSTVGAHHEITPCWDRQYRESTIFFSPPSKCPTNLFGPVSNRAILKQLHVTSRSSSQNPCRRSATPRLEPKNFLADSNLKCSRPEPPISNQPPAGTPISNFQCPSWAMTASGNEALAVYQGWACSFFHSEAKTIQSTIWKRRFQQRA